MHTADLVVDIQGTDVPYKLTIWEKVNRLWERELAAPGLMTEKEKKWVRGLRASSSLTPSQVAELDRVWRRRCTQRAPKRSK